MKICFYCDSIFTFGGVQRVLAVIATQLSYKHDVTILTIDPESSENKSMYDMDKGFVSFRYISYPTLPTYEYIPFKIYSFLYKKILPHTRTTTKWYGYSSFPGRHRHKLIKEINKGEYEIVIGVHVFLSFQLASIRDSIKSKTIAWLHTSYDAFFRGNKAYIKNQEKRFIYQITNLDRIVVLSKNDKETFKKELDIDTIQIYNPVSILNAGKGSIKYKKFLSVGRMVPYTKGFDILIKAFAIFSKDNNDWNLDIVGDGPEKEYLQSIISLHKLDNRVRIYPFTSEVENFYASSSVYIMCSRWEGFSLVLFEAMQHYLPIIASRLPITTELLENKSFSFLFENENITELVSLMHKLSNSNSLDKMGLEAHKYSKKFELTGTMHKWEKLLNELIDNNEKKY